MDLVFITFEMSMSRYQNTTTRSGSGKVGELGSRSAYYLFISTPPPVSSQYTNALAQAQAGSLERYRRRGESK